MPPRRVAADRGLGRELGSVAVTAVGPTMLTLGTWNCRMGFDRKHEAVERLGCDVLVVPECHSEPVLARDPAVSFAWKGRYPRKGLGVFGFGGWRVEPAPEPTPLPWVLPLRVLDPAGGETALLLAIWTVANKSERWPSYAAQLTETIDAWEAELRDGATILAGDFNCSAQGPSSAPHRANIERLELLGMRSAYHAHTGATHGEEPQMTLRWFGRASREYTYHCDFVFLSATLACRMSGATVGDMAEWVESRLSDHTPVTATIV